MKFMMLVCIEPSRFEADEAASEPAEAASSEDDGSFPWLDDVVARGIRRDGDRLRPPQEAKTVQNRDGQILVSDGPFAETKEVICGYDILECADIDEAVRVAAAHPVAAFGKIEVRAVWG
ncbi:MAG: YciI family protein [Streptosporangiaceae bacterium]